MKRLPLWCLRRIIAGSHGRIGSTTTTLSEPTHFIKCKSLTGVRFIRGVSRPGVERKNDSEDSDSRMNPAFNDVTFDLNVGSSTSRDQHSHRKILYRMHGDANVQRITEPLSPKSKSGYRKQQNKPNGRPQNGFRYSMDGADMDDFIPAQDSSQASRKPRWKHSRRTDGDPEHKFGKYKQGVDNPEYFRRPGVHNIRGDKNHGSAGQSDRYDRLPGLGKREKQPQPQAAPIPQPKGEMLFGLHPVTLALKHRRREAHCLYVRPRVKGDNSEDIDDKGDNFVNNQVAEIVRLAEERGVPVKTLSRSQLDRSSKNRPHQGVCLDGSPLSPNPYDYTDYQQAPLPDNHEKSRLPLWLLLYRVQDPMNFGAILRSAYLFGVNRVLTTTQSCYLSPVVSKASSGALEILDVFTANGKLTDFVQSHQKLGWSVLATSSAKPTYRNQNGNADEMSGEVNHSPTPIQDVTLEKPTILLVGNEGEGLPSPVIRACDDVVCASVAPSLTSQSLDVDSLNVSVATGILLHTLLAKR